MEISMENDSQLYPILLEIQKWNDILREYKTTTTTDYGTCNKLYILWITCTALVSPRFFAFFLLFPLFLSYFLSFSSSVGGRECGRFRKSASWKILLWKSGNFHTRLDALLNVTFGMERYGKRYIHFCFSRDRHGNLLVFISMCFLDCFRDWNKTILRKEMIRIRK